MKSKRGASGAPISMMTVIELAFAVLVFVTVYNIYDVSTNFERVMEKAVAEDVALLLDASQATPHDITYVYPQSVPGKNISIIDDTVYVHPKTLSRRALEGASVTTGNFWRTTKVPLERYLSVDGSLFSLTKNKQDGIALDSGAQAIVAAQERTTSNEEKLDASKVRVEIVADQTSLDHRNTLSFIKQSMDRQLRPPQESATITVTIKLAVGEIDYIEQSSTNLETTNLLSSAIHAGLPSQLAIPQQPSTVDSEDTLITIYFEEEDMKYVEEQQIIIATSLADAINNAFEEE